MPDAPLALDTRLYFGKLSVLLVEESRLESDIVASLLAGFKVRSLTCVASAAAAQTQLVQDPPDLVLAGHVSDEGGSFELVRALRRMPSETTRQCPLVLLSGHTLQSDVTQARDCGASFVIAKPVTPEVLYERILWLARDQRPFISVASYSGPDRRFQKLDRRQAWLAAGTTTCRLPWARRPCRTCRRTRSTP